MAPSSVYETPEEALPTTPSKDGREEMCVGSNQFWLAGIQEICLAIQVDSTVSRV